MSSDWDTVPITLRKRVPKGAAAKSEKVHTQHTNKTKEKN